MDRGDYQVALSAWGADYPDAENFYQLFYGRNIPGSNHTFFDHPEYNRLYEQIRFMDNGPERFKIFGQMMSILKAEAPFIIDYNPLISGLMQKWVKNFKRNIMIDSPFKYLSVDLSKQPQENS